MILCFLECFVFFCCSMRVPVFVWCVCDTHPSPKIVCGNAHFVSNSVKTQLLGGQCLIRSTIQFVIDATDQQFRVHCQRKLPSSCCALSFLAWHVAHCRLPERTRTSQCSCFEYRFCLSLSWGLTVGAMHLSKTREWFKLQTTHTMTFGVCPSFKSGAWRQIVPQLRSISSFKRRLGPIIALSHRCPNHC